MRLLVLGGTAWLGSLIVADAVARGHDVTALARGASGDLPAGATFVRADRTASGAFEALGGDWDAVIDVTRQPGQMRAAVAALADRAAHWVFVSSGSAYRDGSIVGGDESMAVHEPLAGDVMHDMSEYGPAKAACERILLDAVGAERVHIARVSLIGGPGDWSGRGVYWPWRFAHPSNPEGRVLVPEVPSGLVQLIDARDLAAWTVDAAHRRIAATANVGGATLPLAEHLATAAAVAGFGGELVPATEEWLLTHDVEPWMGQRSLPLWLPADAAGLNSSDMSLVESLGLVRRPLAETLADTLQWRERHPEIELMAGLSDDDERELLRSL
ncbi:oxidoreductase [Pseudolysinimonas sp.]|jgi:2'-hydroxyisoflavone reductase|uniref:oxidoreductase n=1 Tax=Pseudolysinimonas sp. TaxID=2680009 RepID=UPI00378414F9